MGGQTVWKIESGSLEGGRDPQTSYRTHAPRLSTRALTALLGLMCLTPVVIISMIFWSLPAVQVNQLQAKIEIIGDVPGSFYQLPFDQRNYLPEMQIAVTNVGEETWTNLFVRVNHNYSVFETGVPFRPGETREYLLNRFTSRTGAYFDMRYNPVRDVMVYARLPDRSRATFQQQFDP